MRERMGRTKVAGKQLKAIASEGRKQVHDDEVVK